MSRASYPLAQIIGTILYAAESPSYNPRSVVFTDREALQVPLSKIGELANRSSGVPVIAAWLVGFGNPATLSGIGGLVGMKRWGDLKKQVHDTPVVNFDKGDLPNEILASVSSKLSYDQVKDVKIKKVMMSSDYLLQLGAGFLHTAQIVFDGRAVEDVKKLILNTPLAQKLKE